MGDEEESPSSKLHSVGESLEFSRQRANEALSKFLTTLRFPRDEYLNNLFSCSTCERPTSRGEKRLEAVVMDGTALGILPSLPDSERIRAVFPVVRRISEHQYMIQSPTDRLFIDCIAVSSRKSSYDTIFEADLKSKFWKKVESLVPRLVMNRCSESVNAYLIKKFLSLCYSIDASISVVEDEFADVTHETQLVVEKLYPRQRLVRYDLQQTAVEFMTCSCVVL